MVSVITGTNDYLAKLELDKRVIQFVNESGDLALERIDCSEVEFDRVLEAVSSLPFLSSSKMVILRGLGQNKTLSDKIEQILNSTAESTELIIYEPNIDKRKVYYKTLKKQSDLHEFNNLDERALASWLTSLAKEQNGEISYANASYLINRVGQNQYELANELEKLIIYNPQVTQETINLLTQQSPQSKIFELLDQAFAGNIKRALELYDDQRAQRVEPSQIMGMLTWQLNTLALVVYANNQSTPQISKSSGLNPFVVDKTKKLARSVNKIKLKQLISRAQQIDLDSKTVGLNLDEALKYYILTIK